MRYGAFTSFCACGALLGACSAAGDGDVLKLDGGGPSTSPVDTSPGEANTGEANTPAQLAPAVPCDATTPCTDTVASFCYITTTGSGYCTNAGCADASGCPTGHFCDLTLTPTVCRRPPTGEGAPCKAAQDCAAFEANYCETMYSKSCLVSGCSPQANNCDDAHLCCEFPAWGLPPLCISKALSGGKCS